jgi:hypothetical protein
MREPAKIVAALEIAALAREALDGGTKRHESAGWDDDVLFLELGRLVGSILRWRDARPSEVEHLTDTLRRVHAGLLTHRAPEADEAVSALCPQVSVDEDAADEARGTRSLQ